MRKISLSFLHCNLVVTLLNFYSPETNAQVPIFETVTFGTEKTLPAGWNVEDIGTLNNTWEIITSTCPSSGYVNASSNSHIKIDASASSTDYLYSPVFDCLSFTNGTLKFGIWRADSYDESLYVCFDLNNDNSFTEKKYAIPYTILPAETWTIYEIDLGQIIDHNPKVRIRFNQSGINRNSGLFALMILLYMGLPSTSAPKLPATGTILQHGNDPLTTSTGYPPRRLPLIKPILLLSTIATAWL